jgi:hypothetical protein
MNQLTKDVDFYKQAQTAINDKLDFIISKINFIPSSETTSHSQNVHKPPLEILETNNESNFSNFPHQHQKLKNLNLDQKHSTKKKTRK